MKKKIKKDREEFTKFQLLFSFLTEASFLYKYKFCGEMEKLYFETYDCVYIETYTERDWCCIFTRMNLSISSLSSYQRRKNEFAIITYTVIK